MDVNERKKEKINDHRDEHSQEEIDIEECHKNDTDFMEKDYDKIDDCEKNDKDDKQKYICQKYDSQEIQKYDSQSQCKNASHKYDIDNSQKYNSQKDNSQIDDSQKDENQKDDSQKDDFKREFKNSIHEYDIDKRPKPNSQKNNCQKDDCKKDESQKDNSQRDDSQKDDNKKNDNQKDDSQKYESQKDDSQNVDTQKDDSQINESQKDEGQKDGSHKDGNQKFYSQNDDSQKNYSQKDNSKKNFSQTDVSQKDESQTDDIQKVNWQKDDSQKFESQKNNSQKNDSQKGDSQKVHSQKYESLNDYSQKNDSQKDDRKKEYKNAIEKYQISYSQNENSRKDESRGDVRQEVVTKEDAIQKDVKGFNQEDDKDYSNNNCKKYIKREDRDDNKEYFVFNSKEYGKFYSHIEYINESQKDENAECKEDIEYSIQKVQKYFFQDKGALNILKDSVNDNLEIGIDDSTHDTQVSEGGEADLHKHFNSCDKNPGHIQFIPVNDFDINHLPEGYHDDELVEYIKATADLTVRVTVKMTSTERPQFWPNTKHPYAFYNLRGCDIMRLGTGMVGYANILYKEGTCPCHKCQHSDTPSKVWGVVEMNTATHVVFDDLEARHTTCRFFFDRQDSPLVTLDGWTVNDANIKEDSVYLKCVTCEVDLLYKLVELGRHWFDLWHKIDKKYMRSGDKLTWIVSHPHGCPKQISVGQWIERYEVSTDRTRYTYTTCTCPGSSGALVQPLGYYGLWYDRHVHSGVNSEQKNFSGIGRDVI